MSSRLKSEWRFAGWWALSLSPLRARGLAHLQQADDAGGGARRLGVRAHLRGARWTHMESASEAGHLPPRVNLKIGTRSGSAAYLAQ